MTSPLLTTRGLAAGYGNVRVISDVDIDVEGGAITAVVGRNGAGKTTLALTLAGFTRVFNGSVHYAGADITGLASYKRARRGVALVAEGRRIFPTLSVAENLELALLARPSLTPAHKQQLLDKEFHRFEILFARRLQQAGTLSGGEQQMLAISRALLLEPDLIILDEPSTGLAPLIRRQIFETLVSTVDETGCGCLLIEQQARAALAIATHAYVLDRGRVVRGSPAKEIMEDSELQRTYLGGGVGVDE